MHPFRRLLSRSLWQMTQFSLDQFLNRVTLYDLVNPEETSARMLEELLENSYPLSWRPTPASRPRTTLDLTRWPSYATNASPAAVRRIGIFRLIQQKGLTFPLLLVTEWLRVNQSPPAEGGRGSASVHGKPYAPRPGWDAEPKMLK